jgi:hypothetical protein
MDPSTNALLPVAARVEAAVQKYVLVREMSDGDRWKKGFRDEFVSHNLHGVLLSSISPLEKYESGIQPDSG